MEMHKEELARLKKSFGRWRREKKDGDKIPSRLWDEACRGAGRLGKSTVATALGLNWSQLKFEMELRQAMQGEAEGAAESVAAIGEKAVEPQRRVTVTKIVSLESPAACVDGESWTVVSPDGWKFSGKGAGSEQALRVFIEAVSRSGVKS